MLDLHNRLREGTHPNCQQLGRALEVSPKTIQRDVEFMRDQLNLPIAYDRAAHGFYYTESVTNFPTVQVSHGEIVALLIAQKAVEQYRGTAFEKPLASAFSKLASGLEGESGIALHELTEAISFRPQGVAVTELDAFQTLADAVLHRRIVTFDYQSLQGTGTARRQVRPYHLGCLANQWYLIGHDIDRDALRTFAIARLRAVAATGATFERPADFSVSEMFAGSFSAFQTGEVQTVVVRLDAFAARLARERQWHATQEIKIRRDGSADLTIRVSPAPDLENWILGWGDHAEVLRPAALRRRIADAAKAMAQRYAK